MLSGGNLRIATDNLDRDAEGFQGLYSLTIRATELGSTVARSDLSFNITITDENDNLPSWSHERYSATIREDAVVGSRLLSMEVQDVDQGVNSEFAIFVDPRHAASFVVTPTVCRGACQVSLLLNKPLDYEDESTILFKIFANETQNSTHYSTTNVALTIENVNDNAPSFSQPVYIIKVPENATNNTIVFRANAWDADEGVFGEVIYSISSQKFAVDITTGDVILQGTLDREDIDQYSILISAADGGSPPNSATATVIVHVTDVNDEMPHFSAAGYSAEVKENEKPSGPIAVVWATDADARPGNEITYGIVKSHFSRHFRIKKSEEGSGEIFLKEPLDYEAIHGEVLRLEIIAIDSGNPPHNSTVPLVVTVEDINDNRPEFLEDSSVNISIPEDKGGGVKIGQVRAIDRDDGKNKLLRYLVDGEHEEFNKVFFLNEHTGDITIKPGSSPDFETMSLYEVTIMAEDQGIPASSAKYKLTITVTDVNDNPPVFHQPKYIVSFDEGTTPVVAQVTATDADQGLNGAIRYQITEGNDDGTFSIDEESGVITAVSKLDFESTSGEYRLVVTATDQAGMEAGSRSAETEVLIKVIDVNDNPPIFQIRAEPGQKIVRDVIEGIEGPRIEHFKAVDGDGGRNGFVTYEICSGNDEGLFSISHSEGDLRVRSGQLLDRERSAEHGLMICATDAGTPPLNATLPVTIRVIDVNDNPPRFTKFKPVVRISEDAAVQSVVSRVIAKDLDEGAFGKVVFESTSGEHDETFMIDKKSGIITLSKSLDRESISEYDLEITVKDNPDSPFNSHSTTKTMKIIVMDQNDNPPRFVGKTPYHGKVLENSPAGTTVDILGDKLKAVDDDIGANANVSYTIIRDNVAFINNYRGRHQRQFFNMDPETGLISTKSQFDRETLANDIITLVVSASDRDRQHSDVTVIIEVIDVNDNSPRFRSESMSVGVQEDAQPGSEVTKVVATDKDVGENAKLTYHIERGAFDKFIIEPESGIIRVASAQFLDREEKSIYDVVVVAVDNGFVTSRSSTCVVTIEIDDVNDSRPKFEDTQLQAKIPENSDPGTLISRVTAVDPDLNCNLRYQISRLVAFDAHGRQIVAGGRQSHRNDYDVIRNWFALNATSGEVRVAGGIKSQLIDREVCSRVLMSISVHDENSVNEEVSESLEPVVLTITIEDENDNSPSFVTSSFNGDIIDIGRELVVDVTEEAIIGSELVTLNAVDPDSGNNGSVIYNRVMEGSHVQWRDRESGTLIVSSRIDHESLTIHNGQAWLNTSVLVRDRGTPKSLSKKLKVAMRVRDINDNKPKFDSRHYKISVPENATLRSEILKISASDPDSGPFGEIIYSLKGGRDTFRIRPITGIIYLTGPLDRETKSAYNLIVVATDNQEGAEYDREEASVPLTIKVDDVNDCAPVFIEPMYPRTYSIQENAVAESLVAAVSAKDPDEGAGGQITYSLKPSPISSFFDIQSSSGQVTVRLALTALPRHLEDPKIEVLATDGGGLSSNMTLYLDIVDVNDHAPIFDEPDGKEMEIHEEEPAGTKIGWMKASDADSGLNGVIRYSFCDVTKNDAFLIDEVTGRIVTSKRLDRESTPEYTFHVCANDLAVISRRSYASVTVRLLDRNDNEPEFPESNNINHAGGAYQELHASEGLQVGESVGHVMRAVDRDTGTNAHVYYHLVAVFVDGSEDLSMFSLQKQSRRIILEKRLDREKVGRYKLVIKATNDENYSFASPIVDEGKEKAAVMRRSIKEKSISRLKKFQKAGSGNEVDELPDPLTLMTAKSEKEESPSELLSPSLESSLDPSRDPSLIEVAIVIDDVNDEWPVFEHKEYSAAADIGGSIGEEVVKVTANDNDIGNNSIVTYSIINTFLVSNDNKTKRIVFDVFRINSHSGVVSALRKLEGYGEG